MTTTGERLVTLSELPGVETAMTHFVAITTGGGSGGTVLIDLADLVFEQEADLVLAADGDLVLAADEVLVVDGEDDMTLTPDDDLEVGCE